MIENARDTDEGVFECVARNQLGEVKAEAVQLRYLDDSRPGTSTTSRFFPNLFLSITLQWKTKKVTS